MHLYQFSFLSCWILSESTADVSSHLKKRVTKFFIWALIKLCPLLVAFISFVFQNPEHLAIRLSFRLASVLMYVLLSLRDISWIFYGLSNISFSGIKRVSQFSNSSSRKVCTIIFRELKIPYTVYGGSKLTIDNLWKVY